MIGIINQDSQAGWLPTIGNQKYLLAILVVAILTGLMYIYLNYSKHGYEIAVVGESRRTASYAGIKVDRVIIRSARKRSWFFHRVFHLKLWKL